MNPHTIRRRSGAAWAFYLLPAIVLALAVLPLNFRTAAAVNPPPYETYFVPLPDDWLMQHMEDLDDFAGIGDPYTPVRSVIGITISAVGTLIYWDQWEDGLYDAAINDPGVNIYSASNPDGTQIWGDGITANGCPPRFDDTPNPCAAATDDQLQAGDVLVLDNLVPITNSGADAWLNGRSASDVRFDGKDKFGATYPVAATRAGWSEGDNGNGPAGSLFSDATAIEATKKWGTRFIVPLGTDTTGFATGDSITYAHVTIQAQQNGTTVCVDQRPITPACNGAGDSTATINQGQQYDPTTMPSTADPQGVTDGTEIRTNYPVQVIEVTGTVGSTWATRWYNLKPFDQWTNDYYQPVGTSGALSAVWVYNPNATTITIYIDRPGTANDGSRTCAANTACKMPDIPAGLGGHGYTRPEDGSPNFYPVSVTEATGAQIYDWGYSLIPSNQLSDQVLVGWAPGCTTFRGPNECFDLTTPGDGTQGRSRNPVWVTPLADTTIYVDLDGSGINCPDGGGAERSIAATALTSYNLVDDPAEIVRDEFSVQSYSNNNSPTGENWNTSWTETGETTSPSAGAIQINTTSDHLRFQPVTDSEAGRTIARTEGMGANTKAVLTFFLGSSGALEDEDDLAVEVSSSASGPWTLLERFNNDPLPNPTARAYDISAFISANTTIRFRIVDDLETDDFWYVDNVTINRGTGQADFDMSGARLRTCDGTKIAAAWGQQPALSYSGDDEALDMGTVVFPLGSNITIDKSVDKTWVTPGGQVLYTYDVRTTGLLPLTHVSVTDDRCSPAVETKNGDYNIGDTNNNGDLEVGETWKFTCSASIFVETTNTAISHGSPDGGATTIDSAPDQALVRVTGAIGDYVWLDEDGDGDQDAGEPGIPNVKVTLTGTDFEGQAVTLTTYTDANGGYVFTGLPPSNTAGYTITVDTTTMPTGLAAHPTYDENGTATPSTTTVVLGSGVEHMTADFGYNWSSPCETNTPGDADCLNPTGAIGDRVWIDANGDGVQDPNEVGIPGVNVQLITAGPDGLFGTGDDVVFLTTPTDNNGNYIFDNLAAGAYVVKIPTPPAGTQTGDPDGTLDNQTTAPIVLAPGDVYLNADFGYKPATTEPSGAIGDTVFLDQDGTGPGNSGPGIAGVTVSLIKDTNSNGVWDIGEPIIATDITDENGVYGFSGLPLDTDPDPDYLVWVNDTQNVLNELDPTYDSDGVVTPNISAVNLTPASPSDFNQDFGYAPPGHVAGNGIIGDTIWLDRNTDPSDPGYNKFEPGEGLEGVVVRLYNDTNSDGNYDLGEPLVVRTVTNENGQYFFGDLPAGNYVVVVDTATLPAGLTNTVDPDTTDSPANESGVALNSGEINLLQDFGYAPTATPNTIGGTIWVDTNADGLLTESGRFEGVTVVLRDDSNGNIVATTTTDSTGDYSFTGLPDGTYTVDVTDDANVLNGYWKSNCPAGTCGQDGNSQVDPYTVTVSGGTSDTTGDFGYYSEPAALGDFVWQDDGDGIQQVGEPGIPGVVVTLQITWPSGGMTTVQTVTGSDGSYSFDNLLLDEDFDGVAPVEPTYVISVATPAGYTPTLVDQGSGVDQDAKDSDNHSGVTATTTQGFVNETYDFGYVLQIIYDFGDAPTAAQSGFTSSYPTLLASDGARHVIVNGLQLGALLDAEADGQPTVWAVGDDNSGIDDEDGLTMPTFEQSKQANIGGSSSVSGLLNAWIDYNQDGDWGDSGEQIATDASVPGGAFVLQITVPLDAKTGWTYARFRFSTQGGLAPTGLASDGEVEDHVIYIEEKKTGVTLAGFTAAAEEQTVSLAWETASEAEIIGFNVLRMADGGAFESVNAELIPAAHAGQNAGAAYTLRDDGLAAGAYTYRLEVIGLAGNPALDLDAAVIVGSPNEPAAGPPVILRKVLPPTAD